MATKELPDYDIGHHAKSRTPLLCLGVARTGTASLGEALRILGYANVHHGQNMVTNDPDLEVLDRAADATFPTLPSYRGTAFSRAEWDVVVQKWDVVTDVFAYYAMSLISAYPEAKVILVERNIDSWFQSWIAQKKVWFGPVTFRFVQVLGNVAGIKNGKISTKFITGWIGSNERRDIFNDKAREAYMRHYLEVRAAVPSHLLLDYQLSEGWGPLCRFLNKEVPDEPFPILNDLAAYKENSKGAKRSAITKAIKRLG